MTWVQQQRSICHTLNDLRRNPCPCNRLAGNFSAQMAGFSLFPLAEEKPDLILHNGNF
jgi:hypothetical protein